MPTPILTTARDETPANLALKPWRLSVDLLHGQDFEIAYETEALAAAAAAELAALPSITQRWGDKLIIHPTTHVKAFKVYRPRR